MKWLVTGGLGYIGSHLVLRLTRKSGYEIHILDNLSNGIITRNLNNAKVILGDIRDFQLLRDLMIKEKYDGIFHLAALKSIEESEQHRDLYYSTNVQGTRNLLDLAETTKVKYFIFASSCAVYGQPVTLSKIGINESSLLIPSNAYGETKMLAENLLFNSSHLRVNILRFFNVIGAIHPNLLNGSDHSLLGNLIQAAREEKSFGIYGTDYETSDGTCERDFIDVRDVVGAMIHVSEKMVNDEKLSLVYNLGTNLSTSVRKFSHLFFSYLGKKPEIIEYPKRKGDVPFIMADANLIRNEIGFQPKISIEESIKDVCNLLIGREP